MKSYNLTEIEIKINQQPYSKVDETNQLLELHKSSIRNSTGLATDYNDKFCACCCWTVVLGVTGTIIGATIWCLVKYYG